MISALRRFLRLTTEPVYRTKLLVFGLLGGALVSVASLSSNMFVKTTLLGLSVTIWGVALVQVLWDFVGGDPMSMRLNDIRHSVETNSQFLTRSIVLLGDLIDGNIGIDRIWPTRRTWQSDASDGIGVWHDIVCTGRCIKIVSNTFWTNWLNNPQFRQRFIEHIASSTASAYLVLYDPAADIVKLRAADEGERRFRGTVQMQGEIASSLRQLADATKDWDQAMRDRLHVRLTDTYPHAAHIVWVDDRMLVAMYLSGRSGGSAPTFQLSQPSAYFETFSGQFDLIWDRARPVSDLQGYVARF